MKASSLEFGSAADRKCYRLSLLRAFVVAVVTCSTAVGGSSAYASDPIGDKHDFLNGVTSASSVRQTVELEALFWMCDYASSVGDLDAAQVVQCNAVIEQLKRAKFVGDSEKLLAWWRLNKDVAHRELAGVNSEASECMNVAQLASRGKP